MAKQVHTRQQRLRPVSVHGLPKDLTLGIELGQDNLVALRPLKTLSALLFDWIAIALAAWVGNRLGNPLVIALSVVIIASRQHAIGILMHDAAHMRVHPSKRLNDIISNFFMAFPLLLTTSSYRKSHMAHHMHLNTDKDPDWIRKKDRAEWKVPTSKGRLIWIILREGLGVGVWTIGKIFMNYFGRASKAGERMASGPRDRTRLLQVIYWISILSLVISLKGGMIFLTYWVVPFFIVLPVILKLRSLAEHFGLERTSDLDHSRNYFANAFWLFLLAPHHVNYHLDHHLFPLVPFYNLPRLHSVLVQLSSYSDEAHLNPSMLSFQPQGLLADFVEGNKLGDGKAVSSVRLSPS